MIARLRGEVIETSGGALIVDVQGVGYEVQVPESVLVQFGTPGTRVDLYIRQVIREDEHILFGFTDKFHKRIFDLVTSVSGCGPKSGLSLLTSLGADGVAHAISSQDSRALTRAQGVGPKLAERINLELKDKILEENLVRKAAVDSIRPGANSQIEPDELVDALVNLGYRRTEAMAAADMARSETADLEDQLRVALRALRK